MDNLLKEAIADAKAVRETAFANAKLALEEAFTPKLQSMLSAKLRNEVEGEDDETNVGYADSNQDEVDPTLEAVDVTADAGNDPEKGKAGAVGKDSAGWPSGSPDAEKAQQKLTETDDEDEDDEGNGLEEADEIDVEDEFGAGDAGDEGVPGEVDYPNDGDSITAEAEDMPVDGEEDVVPGDVPSEDDVELEAIIRELEAEEEPAVDEPTFDDVDGDMNGGAEGEEFMGGSEEEDPVEEATDVTADAGNDPEKGKGSAVGTDSGSPDAKKAQQKLTETDDEDEDDVDKELDLEALVKEISDELEGEDEEEMAAVEGLRVENKKLARSLKEHRDVVKFLKNRLVEINLLNAKLLYSNKLFRSHKLSEAQKRTVIETIDRANSAREVKLLYTTLTEALKVRKSMNESASPKKKVMGSASKASASTKPKKQITESTDLKARFQKLANITNGGIARFV